MRRRRDAPDSPAAVQWMGAGMEFESMDAQTWESELIEAARGGEASRLIRIARHADEAGFGDRSIDARDNMGLTAMMWAAKGGYEECLRILLCAGASWSLSDDLGRRSSMYAAKHGHLACLRLLVESGDGFSARDDWGLDALMWSARGGSFECVGFLVEKAEEGAVRRSDTEGRTAAMHAAEMGEPRCLALLVDSGADLEAKDNEGMTAALLALELPEWERKEGHRACVVLIAAMRQSKELAAALGESGARLPSKRV